MPKPLPFAPVACIMVQYSALPCSRQVRLCVASNNHVLRAEVEALSQGKLTSGPQQSPILWPNIPNLAIVSDTLNGAQHDIGRIQSCILYTFQIVLL